MPSVLANPDAPAILALILQPPVLANAAASAFLTNSFFLSMLAKTTGIFFQAFFALEPMTSGSSIFWLFVSP